MLCIHKSFNFNNKLFFSSFIVQNNNNLILLADIVSAHNTPRVDPTKKTDDIDFNYCLDVFRLRLITIISLHDTKNEVEQFSVSSQISPSRTIHDFNLN